MAYVPTPLLFAGILKQLGTFAIILGFVSAFVKALNCLSIILWRMDIAAGELDLILDIHL